MSSSTPPPDDDRASDDGWVPAAEAQPIRDRYDIVDLDVLRDITHEVRGAVLRRLREPRTVAEVAASLDVPVTRLYHHVNRLSELGLIQVVATRQVAAVTERRYQAVAHQYGVDREQLGDLDPREVAIALGGLFDLAKHGFQRLVETHGDEYLDENDPRTTLSYSGLFVSPVRQRELMAQLTALVESFESDRDESDEDAVALNVFIAAFPD